MQYSNPLPKEGINTTRTNPLKELLLLTSGLLILIVVGILTLGFLADKFAHYIPFETELSFAESFASPSDEQDDKVQIYLQTLADNLALAQGLPENMSVTVHYMDDKTINAMATLGGHIIVFRGLLQKLGSENAVAMVLAHEIAHIHHRHPIQTLGRGAIISLALSTLGISVGDANNILGYAGWLTALTFSRDQEQTSDFTALYSLENHYGHTNGATDLFKVLSREHASSTPQITFLSTHPLGENRVQNILDYAPKNGWLTTGKLTPVPESISKLIHKQ